LQLGKRPTPNAERPMTEMQTLPFRIRCSAFGVERSAFVA
jgi:hypothetical protein